MFTNTDFATGFSIKHRVSWLYQNSEIHTNNNSKEYPLTYQLKDAPHTNYKTTKGEFRTADLHFLVELQIHTHTFQTPIRIYLQYITWIQLSLVTLLPCDLYSRTQ